MFSWRSQWPGNVARDGAYSDLFAEVGDGFADVCFYSLATDAPVIGSLEIFEIDPNAYGSADLGSGFVLVNYGRLTCGGELFGTGFSDDLDQFGRVWQSGEVYLRASSKFKVLRSEKLVLGSNQQPNFFPPRLYETAALGESTLEYLLPVDTRLDYLMWFHFAEIDPMVKSPGQRIFDVYVNKEKVASIDVFKQVGGFTALKLQHTARNLTSTPLSVKLVGIVGLPLICGLENYAMVPVDLSTDKKQGIDGWMMMMMMT